MDFERQKPVSDEYRENWERVFMPWPGSGPDQRTCSPLVTPFGTFYFDPSMPANRIDYIDIDGQRKPFIINIGTQKEANG